MMRVPTVSGRKTFLSIPEPEDAKLWAQWLNDFEVTLPLGDEAYSVVTEPVLRRAIEGGNGRDVFMFTICEKAAQMPIGRCLLFDIDHINRSATAGIFLGEKTYWGKGFAKEAFELLIEYGFRILNLHSISLGVFEFNSRAIEMYRRIGFKPIGVKRDARLINGRYVNTILMDLLESEYGGRYLEFPEHETAES